MPIEQLISYEYKEDLTGPPSFFYDIRGRVFGIILVIYIETQMYIAINVHPRNYELFNVKERNYGCYQRNYQSECLRILV